MKKIVKVLLNGPYEVSNNIPAALAESEIDENEISQEWKKTRVLNVGEKDSYHLCRCGHSEQKPFCDGSHHNVTFIGEETAPLDGYSKRAEVIEGETLDLLDDESLCVYARFCDGPPRAWNAAALSGDRNNRKIAIREAWNCTGGRLTVYEKDGTPIEPKLEQEIWVTQDTAAHVRGPLWIRGGIPIEGADKQNYEVRNRVALCRCGESQNKPFCDATHMNVPCMKGKDK